MEEIGFCDTAFEAIGSRVLLLGLAQDLVYQGLLVSVLH